MASVVGLDLGWEWIKAVEIGPDLKILKIGRIKVPRKDKSEGKYEEIYIAKINELFKNLSLSRDNVVINIRGSFILARTYLPPSSDKEAFEQWFVENVESMVPGTPMADVVYSYEILLSGRALIAFARRKETERQLAMLKSCNIVPASIDASCLALYDVFSSHPWIKEKKNFAIMDIGGFSTDFLVIKDGEPFASNEINLGGKDLTKGKQRYKEFALNLGNELERVYTFYQKKENLKIRDIILVGDYAFVPGLRRNLKIQLESKVETADPFSFHKIALPKEHNKRENPYYAQALGLGLKGLSKKGIDLTPYEAKELRQISLSAKKLKRLARISAIFMGLIAIILVFALFFIGRNNTMLSSEVIELQKKKAGLAEVINRQNLLANKITKLKQLSGKNIHWSEILYNLGITVPQGIYFKEISTDLRLVSSGTTVERKTRVVIEGSAANQNNVLEFIKNLEQKFKNIVIENIKGERQCEFKISLGI